MAQRETSEIKKRSDAAWMLRNQWRSILQEAYEMAMAGRNPYAANSKTPRLLDRQFDSTAPNAAFKLANRILFEMTPPDQNWINVRPGPLLEMQYGKDQLGALKKPLAGVDTMANVVINNGNAVYARWAAFLDVVVAGMGSVLGLEDAGDDVEPIIDQAVSQSEIAIEENAKGRISGIFRIRKIKIRDIPSVWEDAVLPEELSKMTAGNKDPEIEVLEATYEGGPKSNVPWYYDILWCKGNGDPVRLVDRVYDICPWTIWRWMTLPGLPYGPGPVLLALADIRTANKVMEMILKNAALALAGMYLVKDDGIINPDNVMITPGGLIPVQSTGGTLGASMVPLTTNREFDIGQIVLETLQGAIRKHLFDASLPPDRATPSSATEIIQRIKELNQDLGGGIGRMQEDTKQYVRRRLEILAKRGLIPPMKIDQMTMKVQINAPLARAAQLAEVETVVQWLQMVISIGGNAQAAMMVANLEKIAIWLADKMGVPPELILSEEERQKMQENVATITAAQQAPAIMPAQAA